MPKIIGLIRQRNGSFLLSNVISHAFSLCDNIIILDDASTDVGTKGILNGLKKVYGDKIILHEKTKWEDGFREAEETKHRQALLESARMLFGADIWLYYFDVDEVITNLEEIKGILSKTKEKAFKIRLFDAHATADDKAAYSHQPLLNFRKYFCPKKRDITMIWKNHKDINFVGVDKREPNINSTTSPIGYCQHYGKALSEKLWEAKCDYYAKHFSERYKKKWLARKGKYIHTKSDFGEELQTWENIIKNNPL